ncbi:MAG: sodium:calcium symporter, partial [Bacteroidia bacterium]|nr:sodium:calcium symporter [Bacteroidia bacterium]
VILGLPLLWVEWAMGRYGGARGRHSTPGMFYEIGKKAFWKYFGVLGVFCSLAVCGYYCYIESWALAYWMHSLRGSFAGMSQSQVAQFFVEYTSSGGENVAFFLFCVALNAWILSRGVRGGIEWAAKLGLPLLVLAAMFLAVRALTLGRSVAPPGCSDCDAVLGVQFLWQPRPEGWLDPKVWFAAAGQVFFTLGPGFGMIHTYASYMRADEDVVVASAAVASANTFVEVCLGGAIVVPIAVAALGLGWLMQNAGFSIAFQTMPFLFEGWGPFWGVLGGGAWFALLFLAGLTSTIAMGAPWMAFVAEHYGKSRRFGALTFALLTLFVGLPTVLFFHRGALDEYDYWTGSFALVVMGFVECVLFAWVFGADKAWQEITRGALRRPPRFFRHVIRYATVGVLGIVLFATIFKPLNNDWKRALTEGWRFDPSSVIGKILHRDSPYNRSWFADGFQAPESGVVVAVENGQIRVAGAQVLTHRLSADEKPVVRPGERVVAGQHLTRGFRINDVFYKDAVRLQMILLFAFIAYWVGRAGRNPRK